VNNHAGPTKSHNNIKNQYMKRDFRPEEIEDWALLYDVHEKIDTALANGTAGVKKAARKGNRFLNIKRNRSDSW
jgi:hypothetical protein